MTNYVPEIQFCDFPFSNSPRARGGYNHPDREVGVRAKWPKTAALRVCFELFGGRFAKAHGATAPADVPRSTSGNSWG